MSELQLSNQDNMVKSRRIASNTLVLFCRMFVITVVNLYTVRWVLKGLGVEDYGIFNAIGGVITTSTCITSVLAIATQRFYSYALGKGDNDKLREIFSASMNLMLLMLILIILLFETAGLWFINTEMTIPPHRLIVANWIFQFSLAAFIFSVVQIPFMGTVFAREHMGVYALISTIDCLAKFLIAYSIDKSPFDHLVFYGAAMAVESLLVMGTYILMASKRYPECRYIKVRDAGLYRSLVSFSGWTFYGTLASVGMIQGSIILLNTFFGPITNAAFAIANQVFNALITLCNSIVLAFRPAMIKAYSGNDLSYLDNLFSTSNKALLYLLAMVAIPFIFEAQAIIDIWLGANQSTTDMILFVQLMIVYTVIISMQNPITIIIQATGQVKYYFLFVESITLASVPLSWLLFRLGMPPYWIFVSLISTCAVAHLVRLVILRHYYPAFSIRKYSVTFILPSIIIIGITTAATWWCWHTVGNQLWQFLATFGASTVLIPLLAYAIGINSQERRQLHHIIHQALRR